MEIEIEIEHECAVITLVLPGGVTIRVTGQDNANMGHRARRYKPYRRAPRLQPGTPDYERESQRLNRELDAYMALRPPSTPGQPDAPGGGSHTQTI